MKKLINNTEVNTIALDSPTERDPAKTIVVIDTQLPDWQVLRDAAPAGSEIILIGQGADGVDVLAEALAGKNQVDALHIFSHGSSGKVQLGNTWLDVDSLSANPQFSSAIQQALSADGDVLIYGCDVAQGEQGQLFVEQLAGFTGADVAASVDVTGGERSGGDWVLEYSSGLIEENSVIVGDYAHKLVTGTVTFTSESSYVGGVASQDLSGVTFEVRNITNTDGTTDTGDIVFRINEGFYNTPDPR